MRRDLTSQGHLRGWITLAFLVFRATTVAFTSGHAVRSLPKVHSQRAGHLLSEGRVGSHATASGDQGGPGWLPSEDYLKALADGRKPSAFWCLRQEGSPLKALCACEVAQGDSSLRSFHFAPRQLAGGASGTLPIQWLEVRELPFSAGKLGGHLWDGGVFMALWLLSRSDGHGLAAGGAELFEGRRVLEMGSGVGLSGIALASIADSVVLTDFGNEENGKEVPEDSNRLVPTGLLRNLEHNLVRNSCRNTCVQHLDWHDFIGKDGGQVRASERFERIIAADCLYYLSDLPALVAALLAHIQEKGLAFFVVPKRSWEGPQKAERAVVADLAEALSRHGQVTEVSLFGHSGTIEGKPVSLLQFQID